MKIDLENVDEDNNKTQRTIYKAIGEFYFQESIIFPRTFFFSTVQITQMCKKDPSEIRN